MNGMAATPCEQRLDQLQSVKFEETPRGYIWVRWFTCEIERLSIQALSTPREDLRAELIRELEDDVCRLRAVLNTESSRQSCPWCSDEVCHPKCRA
jgi:hypothetical protein